MNETYLARLELTNYRLFPTLALDLHRHLTVLTAPNDGGKTAVLDAIASALAAYVDVVTNGEAHGLGRRADIRRFVVHGEMQRSASVHIQAWGRWDGTDWSWGRTLADADGARTEEASVGAPLCEAAAALLQELEYHRLGAVVERPTFPLIAYYGAERSMRLASQRTARPRPHRPARDTVARGYAGALAASAGFTSFVAWFKRRSAAAQGDDDASARARVALATVQLAISEALDPTEWAGLRCDAADDDVRIHHPSVGSLPVDLLSGGIRTMIGLAADLARRASLLNPHLGTDARLAPGIVLIDELDLHLHPAWQQLVLPSLRAAFPNVQLIVTTHSPQLLSTVPRASIRTLAARDDGTWHGRVPSQQTRGEDSAEVLASVMGVDPRPDIPEVRDLRACYAKLAAGTFAGDVADEQYARLVAHYGARSPTIADLDGALRRERARSD